MQDYLTFFIYFVAKYGKNTKNLTKTKNKQTNSVMPSIGVLFGIAKLLYYA